MSVGNNLNEEQLLSRIKELEAQLKRKRKYGLVWEDKAEDVVLECESKYPVLRSVDSKRIRNIKNDPVNVLIEGDNYHALQVLKYTHKGKVDVIYIDPPYNTGNKDFIYNDDFIDKEDGYRHSKWLSFMEKRLVLAKELLADTGVIFISIDDNEQAQLKLLCDGVFGMKNFVGNLVWENKEGGGKSDSNHFRIKHEYILVYASKIENLNILGQPIEDEDRYRFSDEYESIRGKYQLVKLDSASIQFSESLYYPIKAPDGTDIYPVTVGNKRASYRWSRTKVDWGIKEGFIVIKKGKQNKWSVYTKQYINCDNEGSILNRTIQPIGVIARYSTTQSNRLLKDIFSQSIFNYSKPKELIDFLLKVSTLKESLILDFFAGSGTTGHAVLELNKQDGGNRKFILVTNNGDEKSEHKIAEQITYERLKRVINGYTNTKGEKVEGLGGNLEYLKCELIERTSHEDNMKLNIMKHSTEMIALKENVFGSKIEKKDGNEIVFTIMNRIENALHTVAIYKSIDDKYAGDFKKELEKFQGTKSVYINQLLDHRDIIGNMANVDLQQMPQIK